jgi:hypothetical protein
MFEKKRLTATIRDKFQLKEIQLFRFITVNPAITINGQFTLKKIVQMSLLSTSN